MILLLLLLILIFLYINDKQIIKEKKIIKCNKKENNIDNLYNIKDYHTMNENIVNHKRLRNELLEYQKIKKNINKKENEIKQQKHLENKIYEEQQKSILQLEYYKNINSNILSSLNITSANLKNEISNILHDKELNKISSNELSDLIISITNNINKTKKIKKEYPNSLLEYKINCDKFIKILNKKKYILNNLI